MPKNELNSCICWQKYTASLYFEFENRTMSHTHDICHYQSSLFATATWIFYIVPVVFPGVRSLRCLCNDAIKQFFQNKQHEVDVVNKLSFVAISASASICMFSWILYLKLRLSVMMSELPLKNSISATIYNAKRDSITFQY